MHNSLSILAIAVAAGLGCGSATRGDGPDAGEGADAGSTGDRPGRGDAAPDSYNNYFYVATAQGLRSFSIDPETLLLTDRDDVSNGALLCSAADPEGRFVFVAERQPDDDYSYVTYAIDAGTGRLSRVGAVTSTHRFPYVMAVSPAGTLLFVGDVDTSEVASYSIDQTTGVLSEVDTVAVNVSSSSYNDLQVHPGGGQLYLGSYSGGSGQLRTINVSMTGMLSLGSAIDTSIGHVHLEARGRFLFIGPGFGETAIDTYRVDPSTGVLTFARTLDTGQSVARMVTDPEGRFLYVGGGAGEVVVYSIAADGALAFASEISLTDPSEVANLFALSFHPAGGALYALSRNSPGDNVHALRADPQTGALSPLGPVISNLGTAYMTRTVRILQP